MGRGNHIRIWDEYWLPNSLGRIVLTPCNTLPSDAKVDALLDVSLGCQNAELVRDVFLLGDAVEILEVSLNVHRSEGKLVWSCTRNGMFNVRSAYHVALKIISIVDQGPCSCIQFRDVFWKNIWTLNLPIKLKNFTWRACGNSLPTKQNLVSRHILGNVVCDFYQMAVENALHALCSCFIISRSWRTSLEDNSFDFQKHCNFDLLVWEVMQLADQSFLERLLTIAWSMWKYRNLRLFNESIVEPYDLVVKSLAYVDSFQQVKSYHVIRKQVLFWQPPPCGKSGVGAILRNEKDDMLVAMCRREEGIYGVKFVCKV